MANSLRAWLLFVFSLILLSLANWGQGGFDGSTLAQENQRYYPETGHTIKGRFLTYWEQHGGLAQQGFPISEEIEERSDTDGKTYTVQYFERAVFEKHPELAPPYDVLLSLLGRYEYQKRYGSTVVPDQKVSTDKPRFFPETGHSIGGLFRAYWEQHGALPQQGYPISDEFQERNALDGKLYKVQYFERAVFEWHPENRGTPYEVLLSQLGTFRYKEKYTPSVVATPSPIPQNLKTTLSSIDMVSANEGWAVGSIYRNQGDHALILHYINARWEPVISPTGDDQPLYSIDMISSGEGWAGGNKALLHYSGGKWQVQAAVASGGYPAAVLDLSMASVDEGWAAIQISVTPPKGGYGVPPSLMHYSKGMWSEVTVPYDVRCVDMTSPNDGWALCGGILHYNGNRWEPASGASGTSDTSALYSVDMVSANDGWAVGKNGLMMHYDGSRWEPVDSPVPNAVLSSIDMISTGEGWAVGGVDGKAVILHYNGTAWSRVPGPEDGSLNSVSMVSANEGWAVGSTRDQSGARPTRYMILHYQNGTWNPYNP